MGGVCERKPMASADLGVWRSRQTLGLRYGTRGHEDVILPNRLVEAESELEKIGGIRSGVASD